MLPLQANQLTGGVAPNPATLQNVLLGQNIAPYNPIAAAGTTVGAPSTGQVMAPTATPSTLSAPGPSSQQRKYYSTCLSQAASYYFFNLVGSEEAEKYNTKVQVTVSNYSPR